MQYTDSDVLQALAIAITWGDCGIAISAAQVRDGETPFLTPGLNTIIEASPAAMELLARANDLLTENRRNFFDRVSETGLKLYDYREIEGVPQETEVSRLTCDLEFAWEMMHKTHGNLRQRAISASVEMDKHEQSGETDEAQLERGRAKAYSTAADDVWYAMECVEKTASVPLQR